MANLSEELYNYIVEVQSPSPQKETLLAFEIFETFNLPSPESKYLDILHSEIIDPTTRDDSFMAAIDKDLTFIIEQHGIELNESGSHSTNRLNTLANFLIKIQRLDDYYFTQKVLTSDRSTRMKLITLLEEYAGLEMVEALDLVSGVTFNFIEKLTTFAEERINEYEEVKDILDKDVTTFFLDYIGDEVQALGKLLYTQGYTTLQPIQSLLDIVPFDVRDNISKAIQDEGPATAAVDILSMFMICSDSRDNPLKTFSELSETLILNQSFIPTINTIITSMYGDFKNYYDEVKKELNND